MKTYKEIHAWQKAMELVTDIYSITDSYPENEKFGLTNQIRRAAVSVPSNIAEGFGRNSLPDFIRFLNIARGSLFELQTQVEISLNLGFLARDNYGEIDAKTEEIAKLLNALIKSLKKKMN
ncbi:four helix bundle protein [Carboxylicivirga mesophila]|uniref:Four helix bundle protein n=1 Tax=Carboxylicivirga mesophila TaxID=1166478 RepID=A0ABS5K9B8_9BACT|nr:four helix bundle protein [Carboxylicivirga mesophila]MBS2211604.1 four helix bundle protein [Carboxylicivirga mesophila]